MDQPLAAPHIHLAPALLHEVAAHDYSGAGMALGAAFIAGLAAHGVRAVSAKMQRDADARRRLDS